MYYYEVTIYLVGTAGNITFKIDEKEIHSFLKFLTEHVNNLHVFNVVKHSVS